MYRDVSDGLISGIIGIRKFHIPIIYTLRRIDISDVKLWYSEIFKWNVWQQYQIDFWNASWC